MSDGFLQKETPLTEATPGLSPEIAEGVGESTDAEPALAVESSSFEQRDTFLEDTPVSVMPTVTAATDQASDPLAVPTVAKEYVKDEVTIEVEKILEDGLGDFVQTMTTDVKWRFLQKGQEVAMILAGMVRDYKVKVKQAIHLIRDWLLTIPGVNKFFLEQEAKIKTDRILDLEKVRHDGLPATP